MTSRSNVRLAGSPVIHAHARTSRGVTLCGIEYRGALHIEDPADCMACLVADEWEHADAWEIIQEVMSAKLVKDIKRSVEQHRKST